MVKFYTNENFSIPVAKELRKLGHDVLTCQEAGNANLGIPDDEVLTFAIEQNRIVITTNRIDFIRLHRHTEHHFGIIACTFDPNVLALAARIHEAVLNHEGEFTNQLLRIYKPA
jgi:predicted nuclease of predicted toxin-antitoxin system